jgi:hypothetical protein
MKMPGVSLIAVARPTPTPAMLRLYRTRNSRSAATRNSRTALTWPNRKVSRSGSNATASAAAMPSTNHGDQPRRRASGSTSQYSTATAATTVSSMLIAIATCQPR